MASEGDNPAVSDAVQELVDQLVARSETRGDSCVELSELSELIQEADLGDEDAQIVHDMLQERGLDLRDDCGRQRAERGPEEEVDILLREDALRRALEQLPEREHEVAKLRYGVGGDEPTPLVETGRRLGICQDTVRRLERRALAELAHSRELDALRPAA